MPRSRSVPRSPSFTAPVTVVVTPLECQSNPSTHPNAWNQNGSDSRRNTSYAPRSANAGTPTRAARPRQYLVRPAIGDDVDDDFAGKTGHAAEEPRRGPAGMQGK